MLSTAASLDWAWVDVAVPRPAYRLPGVSMAGFGSRAPAVMDVAMVAHPSLTLFVDLNETDGLAFEIRGLPKRGSFVAGLLPGDLRVTGRHGQCLQIRLEPAVAAAVLGAPADLTGTAVALEEVWGREAGPAEDRLRAAASWDERFAIAVDILGRRLQAHRPVDPEVAHAWRRTLASRGTVRVDGLAEEVGWSRKRLWSRFSAQLGISPKRAARLVRFDRAAHLLAAGHTTAGVAADSGYVDQSHLHREVKAFTAATPAAVATAPWLAIDDVAWPKRPDSRPRDESAPLRESRSTFLPTTPSHQLQTADPRHREHTDNGQDTDSTIVPRTR